MNGYMKKNIRSMLYHGGIKKNGDYYETHYSYR